MPALHVILHLDPFDFIETLEGTNGPVASFQWVVANAMDRYTDLGGMGRHQVAHLCGITETELLTWKRGEVAPSEERQKEVIAILAKDLRQRYDDCVACGLHFPSARKRVLKPKEKKVALPVVKDTPQDDADK